MNGRSIRGRLAVVATAALWMVAAMPSAAAAGGPAASTAELAAKHATIEAHRASSTRLMAEMRSHVPAGHRARSARVSPFPASGTSLCVGSGAGCYATIQAALDAAHDGDTIRLGRGTFAGGITITKSVRLVGAGARATIIKGGGSVITIGEYGADVEPTVTITGVTITGGFAQSSPESMPFVGQEGVFALGGGVEIPPNADFSGGADVTITNSVITGNRVAPTQTVPSGLATCPGGSCPFALAAGGGIDSWGTLTLVDSTVSHNQAGAASGPASLASDAEAGGIKSWQGALTLVRTSVDDNVALAAGPNGRFADSGGVFVEGGSLSMVGSSVSHNSASLAASLPDSVDMLAIAGGLHIGGGVAATIRNSRFVGNAVSMTNTVGYATAFSGGLHADVDITASGIVISNNTVTRVRDGLRRRRLGCRRDGRHLQRGDHQRQQRHGHGDERLGDCPSGRLHLPRLAGQEPSSPATTSAPSSPNGGVWVVGGALVGDWGGISLASSTVSRNAATRQRARRQRPGRRHLRRRDRRTSRRPAEPDADQRDPEHGERERRRRRRGWRHLHRQCGHVHQQRDRAQPARSVRRVLNYPLTMEAPALG